MRFNFYDMVAREGDAGGASGGAPSLAAPGVVGDLGATAAAAAPAAVPASPTATASLAPPAADWKLPDGLPDKFKVEDRAEFENRLLGDWKRLEAEVRNRPQAPKSVDEYKYTPSEKVAPFVGDLSADPIFGVAREAALKAGLPADQFSAFLGGLYETLADKGALPKAFDAHAERLAFLGPDARGKSAEAVLDMTRPFVQRAEATVQQIVAQAKLGPAEAAELSHLLGSASGLRTALALADLIRAPGLQPGGGAPASGALSRADLKARVADPRNDRNSTQFNREFAQETDRMYRQAFR